MSVSLVPAEVQQPAQGDNHEGCLICTTSRTPQHAYRPHGLGEDCWCTRDSEGKKVLESCWVAKSYRLEG